MKKIILAGVLVLSSILIIIYMNMDTKVIMKTNMGDITIKLYKEETPKTVENFLKLASEGYYDGIKFHRIIEGFMNQGGDPLTKEDLLMDQWGTGGPGYQFEDEFVEGLSNTAGTLSMANSGPGTNGSQFFINVGDNVFLDGRHTVFGTVIEGMDVVTAMNQVATSPSDRPIEPVVIEGITIK